jgi:hypothetical protein
LIETKTKNTEGVHNLQPRVTPVSALPWVNRKRFVATLTGLQTRIGTLFNIRELFQSSSIAGRPANPGRCPGLKFANAFGVGALPGSDASNENAVNAEVLGRARAIIRRIPPKDYRSYIVLKIVSSDVA